MLNRVLLQGRLVADPERRNTQSGVAVTSFRIACDRDYKKDGTQSADFISIIAWRSTAEFVSRYFTKGDMILVDGRIQVRNYTDRDGNRRSAVEVIAESVNFCGQRKQDAPAAVQPPEFEELGDDSDLPF